VLKLKKGLRKLKFKMSIPNMPESVNTAEDARIASKGSIISVKLSVRMSRRDIPIKM